VSSLLLIVAAGSGSRLGREVPKALVPVAGRPLLSWTLDAFVPGEFSRVVVAAPANRVEDFERLVGGRGRVVAGGETRSASVRLGVAALAPGGADVVAIHDAARPLVTNAEIRAVLEAAGRAGAAAAATAAVDTIKRVSGESVETLDRREIFAAATPQAFRWPVLEKALALGDATDEAALCERLGVPVVLVPVSRLSFKITTPADLELAEAVLSARSEEKMTTMPPRVGIGFDAHPFAAGRALRLGGVSVPHTAGLQGHSDGDALLHALTDAILGAAGLGSIGDHFPPSDPSWKDADSAVFVERARALAADRGWRVGNVDAVVIAEEPRIAPHAAAIRERLAALLAADPAAVSVRGTSTNGLGFTGRKDGIAAAVIVLLVPGAPKAR
jgi:2-C-methyl-D-erythritol 4-phosphate cytidylyltransferase/2-C-methyl-D-erythritol 2,4-cyclodiphosphate synthase